MTPLSEAEKELMETFRFEFPNKIMTAPPHRELRFANKEIEEFVLYAYRKGCESGREEIVKRLKSYLIEHESETMSPYWYYGFWKAIEVIEK